MQKIRNLRIAEIITDTTPTNLWSQLKQVGVDEIVGILPRAPSDWRKEIPDRPWDYVPLSDLKNHLSEFGLKLTAIEDNPPMNRIRYGAPGKDAELEDVITFIKNMGKLGIKTWCYNWMAGIGWYRSEKNVITRGLARTTAFNLDKVHAYPPPRIGTITASELWKNLKDFLETVIPIAEDSGVILAMHPDDPPVSKLRGIPRVMNSIESFDRLLNLVPSPSNAITLCQGNFTLMTQNLPSVIRHFGEKIEFVHFRDVVGTSPNFIETFIDEGMTDLIACMKAYVEIGFKGIMRTDHTPTLSGDTAEVPGYSILGRLHAIGYIQGVYDTAYSEMYGANDELSIERSKTHDRNGFGTTNDMTRTP